MSGLAVAFLIFDSLGKLLEVQPVIDGTKQLGYSPDLVFGLGVTLISCVLAYLVPWTSVLVMNGGKTDPRLRAAARTIADVVPAARYGELPGQTHNVKPGVLAPAVAEFFTGVAAVPGRS